MLDKILAEQKLQRTGAIDEKTAKQIGKIAGVDAIVTGSIADLQSNVGVNCRLIDTTTGDIFGAAQVKIAKDDDVKKIMAVVLTPAAGGGGGAAAPAPAGGPHTWQVESLTFSMDGLRGSGNTATTTIVVDNTTGEAKSTYVGRYYLIDNNGDRWNGHMDDGNDWANLTIAPGTKRRYRWTFAPESAATGTVFTLTNEDGTRSLVRNLTRKP
jgi:hypothetical protein